MKNLLKTLVISMMLFIFAGCASTGIKVATDAKTDADMREFETFNWVSDVGEIPNDQIFIGPEGVLVFNNRSARSTIQEAIETELEARGFTRDIINPDMLASFAVIEQDGKLRTYTSEINSFLGVGPEEKGVEMVDVEPGTILVNFIDADTGVQVWQGFASEAFEESDVENENALEAKVNAIFDQFDFSAFDISTSQVVG